MIESQFIPPTMDTSLLGPLAFVLGLFLLGYYFHLQEIRNEQEWLDRVAGVLGFPVKRSNRYYCHYRGEYVNESPYYLCSRVCPNFRIQDPKGRLHHVRTTANSFIYRDIEFPTLESLAEQVTRGFKEE